MAKDLISTKTEESPVDISKENISEDQYNANPKQFTYDQIHQQDFVINVADIFFAKEIKKEEWEQGTDSYTVKGGGTIKNVLDKYKKEGRKNIKTDPERKPSEAVKKDEVIKVVWEEAKVKVEFKKVNQAELGEEVYVVALCSGQTGKLKIKLKEEFSLGLRVLGEPTIFLTNGEEKKEIEFSINQFVHTYSQKIKIRPKDDSKFKELYKKLKESKDKKTNIYLTANVTDTKDKVNWNFRYPYYDAVENAYVANYLVGKNEKFAISIQNADIEYHIYSNNGEIHYKVSTSTNKNDRETAEYFYHDSKGNIHNIGLLPINQVNNIYSGQTSYLDRLGGKRIYLMDVRNLNNYSKDGVKFTMTLNTNRYYLNDITMASLLGAMLDCGYTDFVFNGCSNNEGRSVGGSNSHKNGVNADMRYLRKDKSGKNVHLNLSSETGEPCGWKGMDEDRQNMFNDALYKYGWKSMLSWKYNGKTLNHSTHYIDHHHHIHLQGYKPELKEMK